MRILISFHERYPSAGLDTLLPYDKSYMLLIKNGWAILYIPTDEGWLYTAIIKDFCLKKIVGYAFSSRIDTNLTVAALEMALNHQKPQTDLIFHSDSGVQ